MTEIRLLSTSGDYVATMTMDDDAELRETWQYGDREFVKEQSIALEDGSTVWIYRGPDPTIPPEPPPIVYPDEDDPDAAD